MEEMGEMEQMGGSVVINTASPQSTYYTEYWVGPQVFGGVGGDGGAAGAGGSPGINGLNGDAGTASNTTTSVHNPRLMYQIGKNYVSKKRPSFF